MLVCQLDYDVIMHRMPLWQLYAAVRGAARRERSNWESSRLIIYALQCMFSEEGKAPQRVQDVIRFWYENDPDEEEPTEIDNDALNRLLEECRRHNEKAAGK